MRKLILLLLFIPLVAFGQDYNRGYVTSSNNFVEIDIDRLYKYLDFLVSTMDGSTLFQAIYNGKEALYGWEYDESGDLGYLNVNPRAELTDEVKLNDGTYRFSLTNKRLGGYLGIGKPLPKVFVFITIHSENNNKDDDNILSTRTEVYFMRKYTTENEMKELKSKLILEINKYFTDKCMSGLANLERSSPYKDGQGYEFDEILLYQVLGKEMIAGAGKWDDCFESDCENCYSKIAIGVANNGPYNTDGYSHILIFETYNIIKSTVSNYSLEMKKIIYEFNFKINSTLSPSYVGDEIDLRDVNQYDLKSMINFFIEDCKKNGIKNINSTNIKANFETLEGEAIALSYGINDDSKIIIKVDPEKWANASQEKRWYILYHELGHDVLNLDHGEGGKMMFNFADRDYSWDEFIEDKDYMFSNN